MKKKYKYKIGEEQVEREYNYIPVRYIIAILLVIFEIALIIGIAAFLCYIEPWLYLLAVIAQTVCVVKIISSDDNPDYKSPWLLTVLLLPIVGFMLYFIFYSRQLGRKQRKRFKEIAKNYYGKDDFEILEQLKKQDKVAYCNAKMLCQTADTKIFTNVKQQYFSSGEETSAKLFEDLKKAEKFIYIEFFIIEEGFFWNKVLSILKEKVAEGVEVKLIYDDFGCMQKLPGDYFKQLKKMGIDCAVFSFIGLAAANELNNRTHRKIVVIDGKIGYTGGINLADEYLNINSPFGHWKDCAVRIEGDAVWELTELFLTDFGVSVPKLPKITQELYPVSDINEEGFVIPFGDGPKPVYKTRVAKSLIQNMVDSATEYCWITTPYLIPDNDLCSSLERSALKGVDVRIIVPHVPDKKIVFEITKSYYRRLMNAGVKIYEYTPGFIHAKSYLVDDKCAVVGTVNLDYRSLVHNFENGVWFYNTECIKDIKADIENTIDKSELATLPHKNNPITRFIYGIIRIFAPLM